MIAQLDNLTPRERASLIWPMSDELRMEAAMCLWEEVDALTRTHQERQTIGPNTSDYITALGDHRDGVGTAQFRSDIMPFVETIHIGWRCHELAGDDPIIPFDWEFVPWFVQTCIDWTETPELKPNWLRLCREANAPK